MIYGSSASFCTDLSDMMCSALACRTSSTSNTCIYTYGYGAADGTICASGKVSYPFKPIYF